MVRLGFRTLETGKQLWARATWEDSGPNRKGRTEDGAEHGVSGFLQRVLCLMSSGQKQLSLKGKDLKLQNLLCDTGV